MATAATTLATTVRQAVDGGGGADDESIELADVPRFADELNSIDFRQMIGGPLQGAVDAQIASSMATIQFIQEVGFETPKGGGPRKVVMVDFDHERSGPGGKQSAVRLQVPLLALIPIPSLRIEHINVDFNARLNSVETKSLTETWATDASLKAGWGPVDFKVSASYQRQTESDVKVEREYTLKVNVNAVQDEMPAGLDRVLGILTAEGTYKDESAAET